MGLMKNFNMGKEKKTIIIIIVVAIVSVFAGFFIGKVGKSTQKDKNIEKADTSFILNIDGIKYDITDKVKSFETGCVMADGSVLTEYLGFSTTVDKERNTVNYSRNLESFTFFPGDKKYVYNDTALNSKKECELKKGVYYVNITTLLVDMGLDVSQSDNTLFVKGYFKMLEQNNHSQGTTESEVATP